MYDLALRRKRDQSGWRETETCPEIEYAQLVVVVRTEPKRWHNELPGIWNTVDVEGGGGRDDGEGDRHYTCTKRGGREIKGNSSRLIYRDGRKGCSFIGQTTGCHCISCYCPNLDCLQLTTPITRVISISPHTSLRRVLSPVFMVAVSPLVPVVRSNHDLA
jgi:hypothetical protein